MSKPDGVKLAGPIPFSGPAVERDARVRDQNDGKRPIEDEWIARAEAQADEISAAEVAFFEELRRRLA